MDEKPCSVDGCGRLVYARGLCERHYQRNRKYGDPLGGPVRQLPRECSIDGCNRPLFAQIWCQAHYRRARKYGDPLGGPPARKPRTGACSIDGCDRPQYSRDWCNAHYRRNRLYGDPLGGQPAPPRECTIDGCSNQHYASGWCAAHWQRNRKYGDPLGGGPQHQPRKECSIEGCPGPALAKGWCKTHYYRARRHDGDPLAGKPIAAPTYRTPPGTPKTCKVGGCDQLARSRGWCDKHYQRWQAHGDPEAPLQRGANGTGWRGLNHDGYVVLKLRGTAVLEHRKVMEDQLGRKLYPFENVHHKNGIKADNDPGNLEVWVKVQPCGQRLEDLVTLAAFITRHYPGEVKAAMSVS